MITLEDSRIGGKRGGNERVLSSESGSNSFTLRQ